MRSATPSFPQRIICLSAETAEIVARLGAADRLVGISAYSPDLELLKEKPKVSAFTTMNRQKVLDLKPEVVLAFSDLQKDLVRELIDAGCTVLCLNHRSLRETFEAILLVGRVIGAETEAQQLVTEMQTAMDDIARQANTFSWRPRVYFEEWPEPLISGICWVSELIERAGGQDIFDDLRDRKAAKDRMIAAQQVIERNPQVIFASWCGKPTHLEDIYTRPGWHRIDAVQNRRVYAIPSADILQAGPSLLNGLRQIAKTLSNIVCAPQQLTR